ISYGSRDKYEIVTKSFMIGLKQDGEKASLGKHQFTISTSTTFNKKFNGVPFFKE
ncbi:unnamed protein product, partial [marine sediment metagenome]